MTITAKRAKLRIITTSLIIHILSISTPAARVANKRYNRFDNFSVRISYLIIRLNASFSIYEVVHEKSVN